MTSLSDYQALAGFRQALRRFLRFSETAAEAEGLTARQHQALLAIRAAEDGRLTIGDLAGQLQVRHHSAVGLVDRLVALKLVVRGRAAGDRRRVLVRLTVGGSRKLGRLALAHRAELRNLAPRLTALIRSLKSEEPPPKTDAARTPKRRGG
jgi:DNA-binding MarR family transcriptional regulator